MPNLYQNRSSNVRKTIVLMAVFFLLIIGLGYAFSAYYGSPNILYIAVAISVIMNFAAYWWSDSIALAMSGARAVSREQATDLYRVVGKI